MAFPGGITMMTDAGPTDAVTHSLEKAVPGRRYIDLAFITHPQADHFGGYDFVLDHYGVGAFLYNGRDDDPGVTAWTSLKSKIAAKHIPLITLSAGDRIHYKNDEVDILSPNSEFDESAELNDTGLVEMIRTEHFRALFAADIGFNVEDWLVANIKDFRADILKVPHHGSKYSSGDALLRAVDPAVAIIEVGAKNVYGQPGAATLARLASSTRAEIFRTDKNGNIEVHSEGGMLKVTREK
jgi:competence protein ComEC